MTQFDSLKLCRCPRRWKLSHFKTNVPYVKPISMLVLKLPKVRHPCIANIQTGKHWSVLVTFENQHDAAYCCHLQLLALKCEVADTCMLCNGHKGVTFVGCKKTSSLKNLWGSPLPWPLYTLYCWLHKLLALGAFIYLWLRVYDFVKATSTEDRTILYCILLYFV